MSWLMEKRITEINFVRLYIWYGPLHFSLHKYTETEITAE